MNTTTNKSHCRKDGCFRFTNRRLADLFLAASIVIVGAAVGPPLAQATPILPGDDAWVTPCGGGTYVDFCDTPIPAGFFGPGSDPFTGVIILGGAPLATGPMMPGPAMVDTVVRRPAATTPAFVCGSPPQIIPIELVALNLVSCSPITVTYGGLAGELWDVRVCLNGPQLPGSIRLSHECMEGGSYFSSLPVNVTLNFTRAAPPAGPLPLAQMVTMLSFGNWAHAAPLFGAPFVRFAPGSFFGQNFCGAGGGPIMGTINGPVADFYLGVEFLPPGCVSCVLPAQSRKRELTPEEAMLAAHGIIPSNTKRQGGPFGPPVFSEACCLPNTAPLPCIDVPAFDCVSQGGVPQGPGSSCAQNPMCGQCSPGIPCVNDVMCDDNNVCTCDKCVVPVCNNFPSVYGDMDCDGDVDIDDMLCVIDGFGGFANCPNGDIHPCAAGDGDIDLDDILAELAAFGGANPCGC